MNRIAATVLVAGLAAGSPAPSSLEAETVRFATFNVAMYGTAGGEVLAQLRAGDHPRARRIAEIIQRVRPDVLVLNEVDYDSKRELVDLFCEKYLRVGQNESNSPDGPAEGIEFPHRFVAESNTGVHSGFDLDRNGEVDATMGSRAYGADCWGYGVYPGQYSLAILSRYPIDETKIRSFRSFRWKAMPGAILPDDPGTSEPADWYSAEVLETFPLSSKNHCDVPVMINGRRIHLLVCHPTPPVFDGAEDRNGRRNHDEVRFWADYIGGKEDGPGAEYIVDDAGEPGALATGASFVILGDLNGDPNDGEGSTGIRQILESPRVLKYPAPTSVGGEEQAKLQAGANLQHKGDPASDTCDPADDPGPGNLRLDYVLPSADLGVAGSGVFWPATSDPLFALTSGTVEPASSDHRMMWADVKWAGAGTDGQ